MSAPGAWLSGTTYATGVSDAVTGYDAATGRVRWSVPLDGDICGASPTQSANGLVAVAYRSGKEPKSPCTRFAVIDIARGGVVWRTALKTSLRPLGLGLTVAVTDQVAAVGWPTMGDEAAAAGGSFGFRLSTGKPVWTAPAQGCSGEEHKGGKALVTHALCGGDWKGGTHRVGHRDPSTGKAKWLYTAYATDLWIASADPLVVGVNPGPSDAYAPDRLVSLSPQGRARATWKVKETHATGCENYQRRCGGVLATRDTLYLVATHDAGESDSLEAFDIATGRRKWSFSPPEKSWRNLSPVRADSGGLTVYMQPSSMRGSKVLHLSAADGEATRLMEMPDQGIHTAPDKEMVDAAMEDPLHYADQRLFLHRRGQFNYAIEAPMTLVLTTR
ncbi:outer membrane protein assembly factor BamB family protein [Streptomyces roseolus]|uniref:outer membrane protein assembly factor BamB family protein n=1 Tax=Streptomyces roseolus TaxID=67358 RepID=UPI0019B92629|nr:PQQ-binding-like beta-propeller repeat protein [Streptomyces roseolus]GGR53940.1 hypothetical protein GCM10010282_53770 [Streptomyces roseolus]